MSEKNVKEGGVKELLDSLEYQVPISQFNLNT